jgi:hypothetical protein
MKKTILATLAVMTAMIGAQAHALDITGLVIAIPLEASVDVTAVIASPTITTAAAMGANDKQAYYAELRDDAVEQVAEGGAPSAVLADAIAQIREQTGTTLSDRELSVAIVKAIN